MKENPDFLNQSEVGKEMLLTPEEAFKFEQDGLCELAYLIQQEPDLSKREEMEKRLSENRLLSQVAAASIKIEN